MSNLLLYVVINTQDLVTRAVLRLVWPSILLQSARDRVATTAETVTASRILTTECKVLIIFLFLYVSMLSLYPGSKVNQFLPRPGFTGAKRRLGTSQRTLINVQTCLVILSSHGRPSVVVTPRVKIVVISRTSSVCIIISLTACILLLRILFLVRSQTASEIKTSPLGGTILLKLHTLKPETLLNVGLDPVNLDMVRCLMT